MAKTEAQKSAQAKWDAENMKVFSVKVKRELYEEVKTRAEANGETVHSLLRKYMEEYIK